MRTHNDVETPQEWWLRTCHPPVQPRTLGSLIDSLSVLGGGDVDAGAAVLSALARAVCLAREKHPEFAEGFDDACGVIRRECEELREAVFSCEPAWRVKAEAMDVAATALRLWMGDVDCRGGDIWVREKIRFLI